MAEDVHARQRVGPVPRQHREHDTRGAQHNLDQNRGPNSRPRCTLTTAGDSTKIHDQTSRNRRVLTDLLGIAPPTVDGATGRLSQENMPRLKRL
jgi:hypothetical protein